ncbi:MAG: hypothetical protein K8W52_43340 [Deltaproteobacteria bacterium]|nr:hypothetical protein [Deltaproteobacteria bacterium]
MCRFSGPVREVGATKIFVGDAGDGRQSLIYAMEVELAAPVAMVLPLPVPADGPDDAIAFHDLSEHAWLFDDLAGEFAPAPAAGHARDASRGARQALTVHAVGAFEASFVPRPADFARLDPRFRLAPEVLAALPEYDDWGFAVFQLTTDARRRAAFHPMGLVFPRRDPDRLFFPTGHVHDGVVHPTAAFDHRLYAQVAPAIAAHLGWERSRRPMSAVSGLRRSIGIDPDRHAYAVTLTGELPNRDAWLHAPRLAVAALAGAGHTAQVRVPASVQTLPGDPPPADVQWQAVVDAALETLREDLPPILAAHATAWRLGSRQDGAPRIALADLVASPGTERGPCAVAFDLGFGGSWAGVVPEVTLSFARAPERTLANAIHRDLMLRLRDRWAARALR